MDGGWHIKYPFQRTCFKFLEKVFARPILLPEDLPYDAIRSIIVIRLYDSLSELLLSIPALRALREHFPLAHISVFVSADIAEVLDYSVYTDEVIPFSPRFWIQNPPNAMNFLRRIRSGYDLAIVLSSTRHSLLSDVLSCLTRAKYRLGSEHLVFQGCHKNFFYNLIAPYSRTKKHQIERNLDIVRYINADTDDLSVATILTKEEKSWAVAFLKNNGVSTQDFILAIHFEGKDRQSHGAARELVRIAKYFSKNFDGKLLVSWMPDSDMSAQEFLNGLPFRPIELENLTLREYASIFFCCDLLICYNGDMMHLAASVGTPLIGIFTESDPTQWKPIGERFVAFKGEIDKNATLTEPEIIKVAQRLVRHFPKSARFNFGDELDISDKVLEEYFNTHNAFNY